MKFQRSRRRWGRAGCVATAAIVGIALAPASAGAHAVYSVATYYSDGTYCADVRSELNHLYSGGGKQYVRADSRTMGIVVYVCGATNWPRSAGYLRAKNTLQKLNGSTWAVCWSGGYGYNSSTNYRVQVDQQLLPSNGTCANGTYRNIATAGFYNGLWYNSLGQSSGNHVVTGG